MEEGNKYKMAAHIKPGIGLRPGDGGIEALTRAPRVLRRSCPRCRCPAWGSDTPTAAGLCRAQPLPADRRWGRGRVRRPRPKRGPAPSARAVPRPPRLAARRQPGRAPGGHGRLQVGGSWEEWGKQGRQRRPGAPGSPCGLRARGGGGVPAFRLLLLWELAETSPRPPRGVWGWLRALGSLPGLG